MSEYQLPTIQITTAWQTSDGQIWSEKDEALAHEFDRAFNKSLIVGELVTVKDLTYWLKKHKPLVLAYYQQAAGQKDQTNEA